MNVKKHAVIPVSISLVIMVVIFISSAQPGDESLQVSNNVTQFVSGAVFFEYDTLPSEEQDVLSDALHPFVRKAAHFTVYALLGLNVFLSAYFLVSRLRVQITAALVICAAYACSDEIHQLFVPGRAGSVYDFMIDFCGSVFGIAVGLCAVSVAFWVKQQRAKQ